MGELWFSKNDGDWVDVRREEKGLNLLTAAADETQKLLGDMTDALTFCSMSGDCFGTGDL